MESNAQYGNESRKVTNISKWRNARTPGKTARALAPFHQIVGPAADRVCIGGAPGDYRAPTAALAAA
jgi:hypothetical protein